MKKLFAAILAVTSLGASAQVVAWKALTEGVQIKWDLPRDAHNGTMNGLEATLFFDPENPDSSRFEAIVDVGSIDTKNAKRDEHLKSADYFDMKSFPKITFRSNTVTKTETGFTVNGKLEIKGVTKEVNIPFTFALTQLGAVFTGSLDINTTDFGIANLDGAKDGSANCHVEIAVPVIR
jgi:polyisoprenoid-binding protein YceI